MTLSFSVAYRTRWGERLVLRLGTRRIDMRYVEGGVWQGDVDEYDGTRPLEYRYEVEQEKRFVRREWRSHLLRIPEGAPPEMLRVRDRWIDPPADSSLHTVAFVHGIFRRNRPSARRGICGNATFRIDFPALLPDEVLAVAGSGEELGDWQRIVPLDDARFPEWNLSLKVRHGFAYKFLIADRRTLVPLFWEEGPDRIWNISPREGEHVLEASTFLRFPERRWRSAGTAIPVFSLRSEDDFGVGEFRDLKRLADWAVATGQRVIQLLPINDTTMNGTWEDSYPYNANSTFALHPQYLHLPAAGVAEDEEYRLLRDELNALPEVDYARVNAAKLRLLRRAFDRCGEQVAKEPGYRRFIADNRSWLMPYAAFRVLRDAFGTADFSCWGAYARYDAKTVETYCRRNEREVAFHCFVQYRLHAQLKEAVDYAHGRGIVLKGDLPIGISRTSVDAWVAPHLFHMDSQAGAPPDAFSVYGQNWGFPTYDWERMALDGYAWWRARLEKMAEYFDAYRIDHILGFFRIWEIPLHSVRGLLGYFSPALPYSADELRALGFDVAQGRYTTPAPDKGMLAELFGEWADEAETACFVDGKPRSPYATQRAIVENLPGDDPHTERLREGLMKLAEDVLFIEDPRRKGYFHPRIAAQSTYIYRALDATRRDAFDRLYNDFFYRRHNAFWKESALRKLPVLVSATRMLACGEDLGMIPDSVPETIRGLRILSLEIQRMPKTPGAPFADTSRYPYLSVCSTSTHDMNPLRAWWEEDRELTRRFYCEVLGGMSDVPAVCETWICRRIVEMHLASPSMFAILPLQDWLSTEETVRTPDPHAERINIPAIVRHNWRYRMHLTLERLLTRDDFNATLREMILESGRR